MAYLNHRQIVQDLQSTRRTSDVAIKHHTQIKTISRIYKEYTGHSIVEYRAAVRSAKTIVAVQSELGGELEPLDEELGLAILTVYPIDTAKKVSDNVLPPQAHRKMASRAVT